MARRSGITYRQAIATLYEVQRVLLTVLEMRLSQAVRVQLVAASQALAALIARDNGRSQ